MHGEAERDTAYPAFDWQAVAQARRGERLGGDIVYRDVVDSTNALAASLLPSLADGAVVIADLQTQGRGRLGRTWIARAGSGLTFTVVPAPPRLAWVLPMAAALAVRDTLITVNIDAALKWPNDVLIGGKKCCGILIESKPAAQGYRHLLGIGLNVREADPSLVEATCLDAHHPLPLSRETLLVELLSRLEQRLDSAQRDAGALREAWRACLVTLGKRVVARTPAGLVHGVAEGVGEDGALLIRRDDGTKLELRAGDISLSRNE